MLLQEIHEHGRKPRDRVEFNTPTVLRVSGSWAYAGRHAASCSSAQEQARSVLNIAIKVCYCICLNTACSVLCSYYKTRAITI